MMPDKPPRLGKVQLQIMQILWRLGKATAREITEELLQTALIAHSTVQTLLRKLEAKGAITHDLEERTFVFRALYKQSEISENAVHDLLTRVFHGSVYGLVSQLLKHENISSEELQRLRRLIESAEKDED